ncbi:hypothetical protein, partial [uncultured Methylobacterium sp.]|uniref:topoisomerase C-terminal repeat-containing protein n=1 Tax=uncultured Methylobacterium sp. TaxID=157278 RepID=UPI0025962842
RGTLPKTASAEALTLEEAIRLVTAKREAGGGKSAARGRRTGAAKAGAAKPAAKKTAATKTPAKKPAARKTAKTAAKGS